MKKNVWLYSWKKDANLKWNILVRGELWREPATYPISGRVLNWKIEPKICRVYYRTLDTFLSIGAYLNKNLVTYTKNIEAKCLLYKFFPLSVSQPGHKPLFSYEVRGTRGSKLKCCSVHFYHVTLWVEAFYNICTFITFYCMTSFQVIQYYIKSYLLVHQKFQKSDSWGRIETN